MTTNSPAVGTTTQSRPKRRRSSSNKKPTTKNAAMIGLVGTLGGALIAAMPSILTTINQHNDIPSAPVTQVQSSDRGSVDSVTFSDSGTKVTVAGSAISRVEAVGVMVSPSDVAEPIWTAGTNVSDGKWSLVVNAGQKLPPEVEIKAFYKERTVSAAPIMKTSYVTLQAASTTSTPVPPAPVNGCSTQTGDGCFTGPGWGPPSIYRTGS